MCRGRLKCRGMRKRLVAHVPASAAVPAARAASACLKQRRVAHSTCRCAAWGSGMRAPGCAARHICTSGAVGSQPGEVGEQAVGVWVSKPGTQTSGSASMHAPCATTSNPPRILRLSCQQMFTWLCPRRHRSMASGCRQGDRGHHPQQGLARVRTCAAARPAFCPSTIRTRRPPPAHSLTRNLPWDHQEDKRKEQVDKGRVWRAPPEFKDCQGQFDSNSAELDQPQWRAVAPPLLGAGRSLRHCASQLAGRLGLAGWVWLRSWSAVVGRQRQRRRQRCRGLCFSQAAQGGLAQRGADCEGGRGRVGLQREERAWHSLAAASRQPRAGQPCRHGSATTHLQTRVSDLGPQGPGGSPALRRAPWPSEGVPGCGRGLDSALEMCGSR